MLTMLYFAVMAPGGNASSSALSSSTASPRPTGADPWVASPRAPPPLPSALPRGRSALEKEAEAALEAPGGAFHVRPSRLLPAASASASRSSSAAAAADATGAEFEFAAAAAAGVDDMCSKDEDVDVGSVARPLRRLPSCPADRTSRGAPALCAADDGMVARPAAAPSALTLSAASCEDGGSLRGFELLLLLALRPMVLTRGSAPFISPSTLSTPAISLLSA